jgi:hypothetical protein
VNIEALLTSSDGIQFRVLLHGRTDAQLHAAIRAEQKFAAALTAEQLEAFNGDFVRVRSLDDVPQVPAPDVPVRGRPTLVLIQGGLATALGKL